MTCTPEAPLGGRGVCQLQLLRVKKGKMTVKINDIMDAVKQHKSCSPQQLRRYMTQLDIKPLGNCRQRPQHYPDDTAKKILAHLGFEQRKPANGHPAGSADDGKMVPLRKLHAVRAAARRGK
jgi:hypothetical protein